MDIPSHPLQQFREKALAYPTIAWIILAFVLLLAWVFGGLVYAIKTAQELALPVWIAVSNLTLEQTSFLIVSISYFGFVLCLILRPDLYVRLVKAYRKLHKKLNTVGLTVDLRDNIVYSMPAVTAGLGSYIEHSCGAHLRSLPWSHARAWESLLTPMLVEYLEATSEELGSGAHLLPSTFNKYARCVRRIFRILKERPLENDLVTIWTELNVGVVRWYNMGSIQDQELKYCPRWWRDYLELHYNLHKDSNDLRFQMRRLISCPTSESTALRSLYLLKNGSGVEIEPMRREIALAQWYEHGTGMKLYPPLAEGRISQQLSANDEIFIIASPIRRHQPDNSWIPLLSHFAMTFHDKESKDMHIGDPGIFYKYKTRNRKRVRLTSEYDDLFLVSLNQGDHAASGFGIALVNDKKRDVAGIRLLTSAQFASEVNRLTNEWEPG